MVDATPRTAAPRRLTTRILAVLAILAAMVLGTVPAQADTPPAGYEAYGNTDDFGYTLLPLMSAGESYTATIPAPFGGNYSWCWSIVSGSLPPGITMTPDNGGCATSVTLSGVPEAVDDFLFEINATDLAGESSSYIGFYGSIESNLAPTTTELTAPVVAPYDDVAVAVVVTGTPPDNPETAGGPEGSVEYYVDGTTLLETGAITNGSGTDTVTFDLGDVGSTVVLTAKYLGDDFFGASTSGPKSVLLYVPTVGGMLTWNGRPVEGALVELVPTDNLTVATDSVSTNADGEFELSPGAIATVADATKEYAIRATFADDTVLYYADGGWNVSDVEEATFLSPTTWVEATDIERRTPPVWDDETLATPRVGGSYSDGVSATSANRVRYSVDAGELPSGLTLDLTTGEITGVPDACDDGHTPPTSRTTLPSCDYDFTIKADNGYGSVTKQFTGTLLPAGVPPTWEDDILGSFQAGVAADDGVLAAGDPTIVYTVTGGTLPAGLVLDPATGAITGIPTTAGPYEFTITAENDYGSIDAVFEGEVAASPDLALVLEFEAGTSIEDAASTISAEGLLVGSTYTLTMFSTPRVLYTGTVDGSGGFTWVVSLPTDTPAGAHKLVLTGTAADGTPMSATAWFTLGANGKILAISYTGPTGTLAATGVESGSALLLGGMLLLVGIGAVTIRRRRTA
ncbi:putative Ig domain-containing protein [Pseudolysinimonas sp.]|jgi:LPXTG-motif cell wall-anchored protein|uniref:putative Ig domain-containing protein n=1 Tax=Pseudolysinimonas sp. TaxID=2680009 RepID=UPI0037843809